MNEATAARLKLRIAKYRIGKDGEIRGTIQEIDADGISTGEELTGSLSTSTTKESGPLASGSCGTFLVRKLSSQLTRWSKRSGKISKKEIIERKKRRRIKRKSA